MSTKRTIADFKIIDVIVGSDSLIDTPTSNASFIRIGHVVTLSNNLVHFAISDEEVSLRDINRRLNSINRPLKGGETNGIDIKVTSN